MNAVSGTREARPADNALDMADSLREVRLTVARASDVWPLFKASDGITARGAIGAIRNPVHGETPPQSYDISGPLVSQGFPHRQSGKG